jgi:Bacterial Ig-like domain
VESSFRSVYFWRMIRRNPHRSRCPGVTTMVAPVRTRITPIAAIISFVTAGVLVICCTQCATPVVPRGGPKDVTPPSVVVEESTPNPMTNFDLDQIRITLDEWVQLKNASTQMVISPPIEPRPFPRLDRKTVVIDIDPETILDNTTYTINFGEAIQDITESNPLVNHTFVFSKGPFVDSLSMSGTVMNAQTGEPEPGARFILHDNPSDTAISKLLPSYFSTTDEDGRFQLNYLRPDTFKAYAIKEAEFGNYRYDIGEQLGFLSEPVILRDTVKVDVRLWIFSPSLPVRAISARRETAAWKVALTREASFIGIAGDTASVIFWTHKADTIKLWHNSPDTLDIEILEEGVPFDTVQISPYIPRDAVVSIVLNSKKLHPDDNALMSATTPVASVNTNLVRVAQGDSIALATFNLKIDQVDPRNLELKAKWTENAKYHVRLLPGALTDVYGNSNDSLDFVISVDERINFSLLNLAVVGFDTTVQYVVQLLDGETLVESRIVSSETDSILVFDRLAVKDYTAKIIEDRNANGIWDSGDLETKRQPERIFMQKLEGMRPGWDLDLTITWPER